MFTGERERITTAGLNQYAVGLTLSDVVLKVFLACVLPVLVRSKIKSDKGSIVIRISIINRMERNALL